MKWLQFAIPLICLIGLAVVVRARGRKQKRRLVYEWGPEQLMGVFRYCCPECGYTAMASGPVDCPACEHLGDLVASPSGRAGLYPGFPVSLFRARCPKKGCGYRFQGLGRSAAEKDKCPIHDTEPVVVESDIRVILSGVSEYPAQAYGRSA